MRTIDEVRRENLGRLIATAGSQAKLSELTGKAPAQISQWLNGSPNSKTGKPRVLSTALARELEERMGKPSGWMDADHRGEYPSGGDPLARLNFAAADEAEYAGAPLPPRLVPIVGTARMGEDGHYDELSPVPGAGDGHIDIATKDPNAYGLRVKGQSMFPAIRDGWYVVVEPNGTPREGEYVLLKLRDGQKMVKEFLFRRAEAIEVMSVNGGDRMTIDYADVEIQPVAAVVPPSKWRPD